MSSFKILTARTSCMETNSNTWMGIAFNSLASFSFTAWLLVEEADMRRVAFLPHMLKMQWLIFKAIPPTRPASPNGLEDRIRYLSLLTIQPTLYLLNRREYSKECVRKCIVSILFFSIIAVIVFKTSNCVDMILVNSCRYVKSRNDKQLRSKAAEGETTNCFPEDKTKDNQPIVPCGLIAWSLFNDTYKFSTNNKDLTVNKKNIAWGSDQRSRFGSDVYPKNFQRGDLIGGAKLNESIPWSQQEDLIVWMRTAALPTFRKLYGKIEVDLEVNDEIEIAIENNYNTYEFGGKKKLVLSTTTVMGGKNPFLGTAYLFVGGLSLLCAIGFILLYVIKPRPLGDPSYLPWNRNPGSIK
ncbi:ALA-interacting subunit 3 [Glycine soja]